MDLDFFGGEFRERLIPSLRASLFPQTLTLALFIILVNQLQRSLVRQDGTKGLRRSALTWESWSLICLERQGMS
jgi:hypothetical protein